MTPTDNDVLSGRGAWCNQHPGNKQFRKMIDKQKDAYKRAERKKQKMDISKAIMEAVYSKDPPGRFLKRCSETGQWKELSNREAADRVVQAMAYASREKEESKRRREELRRSRQRSQQQSVDRSVHLQQDQEETTNQVLGQNDSSSVAHHELAVWRGGAQGTRNNTQSATDLFRVPGNSNLQQQLHLLQQLHQSSTSSAVATLPTSADNTSSNESADQNGLIQLLLQTQQQQQQQQLLRLQLQHMLVPPNNPLGQLLQPQTALQPALNVGMTHHLLNQAQQQQQQQPNQLLLLQQLLNQQNMVPSASLPMSMSISSAPFLRGRQPQSATNLLLNLQQQSNLPASSSALLLNKVLSHLQRQPNPSLGISNAPQSQQQQTNQLQRSMMLQQNQLLATSNNQLPFLRRSNS